MRSIRLFIGLICSASIIVSCASTEVQENAQYQKATKTHPLPQPITIDTCWDGSIPADENGECPPTPTPIYCWTGTVVYDLSNCPPPQPPPEPASLNKKSTPPPPSGPHPCWDGSFIFDPNQTCPIPCQDGSISVWDNTKQEQTCPNKSSSLDK